jgi:hypothetical protein
MVGAKAPIKFGKWQYPKKSHFDKHIGPLSFEFFARFAIRYTPEEIQYYMHAFLAHFQKMGGGIDRNEGVENKHSHNKQKVKSTTMGGAGKTMLSQQVQQWSSEIYRHSMQSEKCAMRAMIVGDLSKLVLNSTKWKLAKTGLDDFDQIPTIEWKEFTKIQRANQGHN